MNGKADENGNHLDGERSGADHQLLRAGGTAQHEPDGARHSKAPGGKPWQRKKQAGACSFRRLQADRR